MRGRLHARVVLGREGRTHPLRSGEERERAGHCQASVSSSLKDFHLKYKKGISILGNPGGSSRATHDSKWLSGEKGPLQVEA